jgi:hypothetical protein
MTLCYGYIQLREKYPEKDDEMLRGSCYGEAVWEVAENVYCVLHAPTEEKAVDVVVGINSCGGPLTKTNDFELALDAKHAAGDDNLLGAWFPGDGVRTGNDRV